MNSPQKEIGRLLLILNAQSTLDVFSSSPTILLEVRAHDLWNTFTH